MLTTEVKAMARAFEVYAVNAAQAVDFKRNSEGRSRRPSFVLPFVIHATVRLPAHVKVDMGHEFNSVIA
jgi:hypothetical protein